ncbi:MAG: diacylglycerol/lipid kinase family protein [Anaeroplasma sp.]
MKALLIYNNHSGKNKIKKKINKIKISLEDLYEITCFESCGAGSISDFIIVNGSNYDMIIVAGGDGTIHEAINGIMKLANKPALSFIPAGTCNDAAKTLGFSKKLKKSIQIIRANKTTKLDVSFINNSYFLYGLAAGSLSEISYKAPQKSKILFGKFAYYLYIFKALKDANPISINIKADDVEYCGDYSLFLATNSRYLAGFPLKRKKEDNLCLNDGKLRIILISNKAKLINLVLFARFLIFGQYDTKDIKVIDASKIEITSINSIAYNTDGEFNSNEKKIEVEVIHNAINIITNEEIIKKYFK